MNSIGINIGNNIGNKQREGKMERDIDPEKWYLPSQAVGIGYLIHYCIGNLPEDVQYQTISVSRNERQIEFGLGVFNQARMDRYPYFLYTYDCKDDTAYMELLPWISDINRVFEASPVLETAIYLQIRQALKWAAGKGVYGMAGLKLVLIPEDIIVNLPDMDLYSYGYIPIFTDFSNCTRTGNIVDELSKYPIDNALARQITVRGEVLSSRLLYPASRNLVSSNCSRFHYMIESYYLRLQSLYNYYTVNMNNFWTPVLVAIMKEYSVMIRAIGNYCFSESRIYFDKKVLIDRVDLLSIPQVVNIGEMNNWQQRVWMSTNVTLDKTPTIDNYVKGLRYYCYLRTCQSIFTRVKIPSLNISVEAKEREIFDLLGQWQRYLIDNPSNLAAYRALFVGDVEEPTLYTLACDPLSFDLTNQVVIRPSAPVTPVPVTTPVVTPVTTPVTPLPVPSLPTGMPAVLAPTVTTTSFVVPPTATQIQPPTGFIPVLGSDVKKVKFKSDPLAGEYKVKEKFYR